MATDDQRHQYTLEVELPVYTRQNLDKRAAVVAAMLLSAEELAPGHVVEHHGYGGDEVHLIHVASKFAALRLVLRNRDLLRAAYRQ